MSDASHQEWPELSDPTVRRLVRELEALTPEQQDAITILLIESGKRWGTEPKPSPDLERWLDDGGRND